MANRARGEVDVTLAGERVSLVLGLRTLAELEDAFNVASFEDALSQIAVSAKDGKVSAKALLKFALALIRGNRLDTKARVEAIEDMTPAELNEFLFPLFERSGFVAAPGEAEKAAESAEAPLEVPSAGDFGNA